MNATFPLAQLVVTDHAVMFRPRLLAAAAMGTSKVPLTQITTAYRLRGRLFTPGVGLNTTDGRTLYFWTLRGQDQVLGTLADRGVAIDPSPRPASAIWSFWSSASPGVHGAPLRPWVARFLPITMVLGLVVLIVFESRPGPVWWRVWLVIVWAMGTATSFRVWRGIRQQR